MEKKISNFPKKSIFLDNIISLIEIIAIEKIENFKNHVPR